MKFINKYRSPNYNNRKKYYRIKYIILHYTAMKSDVEALEYMCDRKNKVSAHFLINKLGKIFNLVNTNFRAWHAGFSYWKKETDINSASIGIEIDNSGYNLRFENYTKVQISSLNKLLIFLKDKYNIRGENILGHSDIAPYRKIDPGEKFPWQALSKFKISLLPKRSDHKGALKMEALFKDKSLFLLNQKALFMLSQIGFDIKKAQNNDKNYYLLIKAYQSHYRPSLVNGTLDKETFEIIIGHFKQSLTN